MKPRAAANRERRPVPAISRPVGRDSNADSARRVRTVATEERRVERRARLIAAAADVYGEVGYRNATVRMICRRARLTERYFYEAFGSNEKLLVEAAAMLADQMHAHLREMLDGPADTTPLLARVLTEYFRVLSRQATKARVFTLEIRGISAEADAELERILDAFAELLVGICDPAGVGPAAGDRLLRRGIVGGILQIAIAWIEGGYRETLESVARAAERLCGLACVTPDAITQPSRRR